MRTTGLAFSGGKDSWACLLLNRDRLNDIQVIWVNTGKNFPETIGSVRKAKELCPNFVTLTVDRDGQNAYHGLPSDIVPVKWTREGQTCCGDKDVLVQSFLHCCYENLTYPMMHYCREHGIQELIIGQRNDEQYKSPSKNGDMAFGIKRLHPIEDWTKEQVLQYLSDHMEVPQHFNLEHSSMDCYDCTAYRTGTRDISAYRKIHWPELDQKYMDRKDQLDKALKEALEEL